MGNYTVDWMERDIKKTNKGDWGKWFDPGIQKLKKSLQPIAKNNLSMPVDFGGTAGQVEFTFSGEEWTPDLRKEYAETALTNINAEVQCAYRSLGGINNNDNPKDNYEVVGVFAFDEAMIDDHGVGAFLKVGDDGTYTTIVRTTAEDTNKESSTSGTKPGQLKEGKTYKQEQVIKEKVVVLFIRMDEPLLQEWITREGGGSSDSSSQPDIMQQQGMMGGY